MNQNCYFTMFSFSFQWIGFEHAKWCEYNLFSLNLSMYKEPLRLFYTTFSWMCFILGSIHNFVYNHFPRTGWWVFLQDVLCKKIFIIKLKKKKLKSRQLPLFILYISLYTNFIEVNCVERWWDHIKSWLLSKNIKLCFII